MRIRRTLLYIAAGWVGWTQFGFADTFTERVVTVIQKAASDLTVSVKDHNELQVQTPTGPFTLYLDNVRAACASKAANCDKELESFVSRTVSVIRLGEEGK